MLYGLELKQLRALPFTLPLAELAWGCPVFPSWRGNCVHHLFNNVHNRRIQRHIPFHDFPRNNDWPGIVLPNLSVYRHKSCPCINGLWDSLLVVVCILAIRPQRHGFGVGGSMLLHCDFRRMLALCPRRQGLERPRKGDPHHEAVIALFAVMAAGPAERLR